MSNEDVDIMDFFSIFKGKSNEKKENRVYGKTLEIKVELYNFMNKLVEKGYKEQEINKAIKSICEEIK